MKKSLILLSGLILPILAGATDSSRTIVRASTPNHVSFEKGMYAVKISPNGEWIGSQAGSASLYNSQTGERFVYEDCYLGLGNAVTNDGVAVGSTVDVAVIFKDGVIKYPEALKKYWFSNFNALTPDATRAVGFLNNEDNDETQYVPAVFDLDSNGEVTDIIMLPYPKLDFFNVPPQFVTAVWISDDGKTVIGQVLDWRGHYAYPIYYKENSNGEWKYELPSAPLFNPLHLEIPENPWTDEPEFPYPENFMSGIRLQAYMIKYQEYLDTGLDKPVPEDYMSDEEYKRYENAVNKYNEWFYSQEERINDYIYFYDEMLSVSPTFGLNEMSIHPSGEYFMTHGGDIDYNGDMKGKIYSFSTIDNSMEVIDSPESDLYPSQILSDGTLIAALPMTDIPSSYIKMPGSDKFQTVYEYLHTKYPEIGSWLSEEVPMGTGLLCVSENLTVMAGGLLPAQLGNNYDDDTADFYYSTYIINTLSAGVEEIALQPEDGVYVVYNLQGVKVLETKDVTTLKSLGKGLYIINGKKVVL